MEWGEGGKEEEEEETEHRGNRCLVTAATSGSTKVQPNGSDRVCVGYVHVSIIQQASSSL